MGVKILGSLFLTLTGTCSGIFHLDDYATFRVVNSFLSAIRLYLPLDSITDPELYDTLCLFLEPPVRQAERKRKRLPEADWNPNKSKSASFPLLLSSRPLF